MCTFPYCWLATVYLFLLTVHSRFFFADFHFISYYYQEWCGEVFVCIGDFWYTTTWNYLVQSINVNTGYFKLKNYMHIIKQAEHSYINIQVNCKMPPFLPKTVLLPKRQHHSLTTGMSCAALPFCRSPCEPPGGLC